jgi:hypothetical protein
MTCDFLKDMDRDKTLLPSLSIVPTIDSIPLRIAVVYLAIRPAFALQRLLKMT